MKLPGSTSRIIENIKYSKIPKLFYFMGGIFIVISFITIIVKVYLLGIGRLAITAILGNWGSKSGINFYLILFDKMYNQMTLLLMIFSLLILILLIINLIFAKKKKYK